MLRSLLFALGLLAIAPMAHAEAANTACADIPFADADAAAVSVPSAADAWGGPRADDAPTLSDRVVRYQIDATLDPDKHTLDGRQTLTWRNRSAQPVCAVYLHLYLNAFEGAGSTFMTEQRNLDFSFRSEVPVKDGDWGYSRLRQVRQDGQDVKWSYVHPDGGPQTDRTVVRLELPRPVAPGASATLDIGFFNQLPRVVARTGYYGSFHLVGQWFPKIGVLELPGERGAVAPRWNVHEFHLHSEFYADYGEYDVRITVPKGYTVGATGEEQGAPVEKDGKLTHRFVQADVHDFAWTADKRYAAPLEGEYVGPGSPRVKVRVLYPPEYEASAKPALKATIDSLAWFSRTLGPYPYRTATVVIPPYNAEEAGGMEYPTFFTASGFDKVEPGTVAEYALDFVTIHEFGHGYFYGILGSNEFEEPMLDEGLNEYWDQRMLRERKQAIGVSTPLLKRLGFAPQLDGFAMERLGAMLKNPADGLGQNAWDRMSSGSYGSVYSRTATVMRDLEARVGTPAMERAFKLYYRRWKFRHPGVADLREALAEGTGQREAVEQVFAQQVYATRAVSDQIANLSSREVLPQPGYVERNGELVEVTAEDIASDIDKQRKAWKKQHPDAKPGSGPFPFRTTLLVRRNGADVPQVLVVKFADGSSETVRFAGDEPWRRFSWVKPARAVSAQLDPQRQIYLDDDKLDDSRTLKADGSPAWRWASAFGALLKTFLALLVSV
ncbi:MAG: M1 family metallopeptidase [Pseudoxanthomonas sp.]